jgi:hypothetical protein
MRGDAFEVWGFVGTGIKTSRFSSIQEARTWAGQFTEWVIYERARPGWRAVQHNGERGLAAATGMSEGAA